MGDRASKQSEGGSEADSKERRVLTPCEEHEQGRGVDQRRMEESSANALIAARGLQEIEDEMRHIRDTEELEVEAESDVLEGVGQQIDALDQMVRHLGELEEQIKWHEGRHEPDYPQLVGGKKSMEHRVVDEYPEATPLGIGTGLTNQPVTGSSYGDSLRRLSEDTRYTDGYFRYEGYSEGRQRVSASTGKQTSRGANSSKGRQGRPPAGKQSTGNAVVDANLNEIEDILDGIIIGETDMGNRGGNVQQLYDWVVIHSHEVERR